MARRMRARIRRAERALELAFVLHAIAMDLHDDELDGRPPETVSDLRRRHGQRHKQAHAVLKRLTGKNMGAGSEALDEYDRMKDRARIERFFARRRKPA